MKSGVTVDELKQIMSALMKDECIIGKVPNLKENEVRAHKYYFLIFFYF